MLGNAIIELLVDDFKANHGIDLRDDRQALHRITEAAEEGKNELRHQPKTEINIPFIAAGDEGPKDLELTLERIQYEAATNELINQTIRLGEKSLQESPYTKEDVDEVIMLGEFVQLPLFQRKVEEFVDMSLIADDTPI